MRIPAPLLHCGLLLAAMLSLSCQDFSTTNDGPADGLVLERLGGGDLAFTLVPFVPPFAYEAVVTHYNFRDTLITLGIVRTECDPAACDALFLAMSGDFTPDGDFTQSTLDTGSWVYVYLLRGRARHEVTNVTLRNELLKFEGVIRKRLQSDGE